MQHTVSEWRTVFWISFAIFIATSVVYALFGSGEEQWWNDPNKTDKNTTKISLETSKENNLEKGININQDDK